MTTIDRRVRTQKWIEYWLPAGASAKDLVMTLAAAAGAWFDENDMVPASPNQQPPYDDWFTIHPHDEHVIVRIKCPDETTQ